MTVFELVGLPGAGKTTLARRLLKRLAAQGLACGELELIGRLGKSRAGHLTRLAGFTLAQGRHVQPALQLAGAVKPRTASRMRFAAKLAVWPYRFSVARTRGYDTVVLDQGILQSVWSVLLDGSLQREDLLDKAIGEVLASCRADFSFISVGIGVAEAAERIHARDSYCPPFGRDKRETLRLLHAHSRQLDAVIAAGVRAADAPHLRLDGTRPVEDNAARLDAFVDTILAAAVR